MVNYLKKSLNDIFQLVERQLQTRKKYNRKLVVLKDF